LLKYLVADIVSALGSWSAFYAYRKLSLDGSQTSADLLAGLTGQFYTGLFLVPFFWLFLYYISGYYSDVFRKSRLSELWITFGNTFIGTLFLFLIFHFDGAKYAYHANVYTLYIYFFIFHFSLTYLPRLIITTNTTHRVHRGEIGLTIYWQ
jgi:hypothetical protein